MPQKAWEGLIFYPSCSIFFHTQNCLDKNHSPDSGNRAASFRGDKENLLPTLAAMKIVLKPKIQTFQSTCISHLQMK